MVEEEVTAHGCDRETERRSLKELGMSEEVTGRDPHPKARAGLLTPLTSAWGPPKLYCAGKAGPGHSCVWDGDPD